MMASLDLRSSRPMVVMSISSMWIVPDAGSTSLNSATPNDDFPERIKAEISKEYNQYLFLVIPLQTSNSQRATKFMYVFKNLMTNTIYNSSEHAICYTCIWNDYP